MKLEGKNLGERQHDFNTKVNEAISQKINFAAIRDDPVDSDIDQLFKIDIASRLKDVAFVLQTLVSGDSLYITRALKSVWLFDDEYQLIINPDYLAKNIFPHMSSKIMKKLLKTASKWIKNEERAEIFYMYCKQNSMDDIALKFLVSTTEAFKQTVLENDFRIVSNIDEETLVFLIGSSFKLADLYQRKTQNNNILYKLRFLYSVDSNKYLDMLETCTTISYEYDTFPYRFGLRISKAIFTRHKERILKYPCIYTTILNKNSIEKFSNSEDAKRFFKAWLPTETSSFWADEHYLASFDIMNKLEYIINLIPLGERYEFLNKIYFEKYASAIELNSKFYRRGYHKHMTEAQQEKWALDQLASKNELLGAGQDFLWYRFIRFDLSLEEMKKLILITKNEKKRIKMLCVLVECTKNQTELEKLLNYFYLRHSNEKEDNKIDFLDCVNENYNIFSLGEGCWNTFNKLLHSIDVYTALNYTKRSYYQMVATFYHILHGLAFPEVLRSILLKNLHYYNNDIKLKAKKHDQNGPEIIYEYILKIYLEELINFEREEYDDDIQKKARVVIFNIEYLRDSYDKKDNLPEIVRKFKKLDKTAFDSESESPSRTKYKRVTHHEFIRMLKKDATLVTEFDLLERSISAYKFHIKVLLQKLNLYFHDDTAQQYLEHFKKAYLKEDRAVIFTSVYGILLLADETFKTKFILEHTPQDSKVPHDDIERNLLYIREAICRFACFSRPTIKIDYILPYITGDYLKYCIDMFNVYLMKYPPAIREKFVKSLLNRPVSIQKHGIRLAFQCFQTQELITILLNSWKKYHNVSLRMVIYKNVFSSVIKCEITRKKMFEVLVEITLDLKEDECEDVMKILLEFRNFPSELRGVYLDAFWTAIGKFSDCKSNIKGKVDTIRNMVAYIGDIPKETLKKNVTGHIDCMLVNNKIIPEKERSKYENYDKALWDLTFAFICEYCKDEDVLELVKLMIQISVKKWNDAHFDYKCGNHIYVFQRFCSDFITIIIEDSYRSVDFIYVLESILACLSNSVPKHEIFVLILKLKVVIVTNRILNYGCVTYKNSEIDDKEAEDIAKEYVKELEKLVKELIQNKLFSIAFIKFLGDVIVSYVRIMTNHLPGTQYPYKKLLIFVASYLADSNISEIVLLAVAIMPGFDEELKNYNSLLDKLAKIDNIDVKYLMNIKFSDEYRVQRRKI